MFPPPQELRALPVFEERPSLGAAIKSLDVSVVIPAYNEEEALPLVLRHIREVMERSGLRYEVIVVDDSSEDGTARIAQEAAQTKLLRHPRNLGYGAALKTGIRHAISDLVCITDADGTYPFVQIPELVRRLKSGQCEMIVGVRDARSLRRPFPRRVARWILRRLSTFVAGQPVPDTNSGLRIVRKQVVLKFFSVLPDGFSFTTTITLGMLTNGYLVEWVPIGFLERLGQSKIRPVRDSYNFAILICRVAICFAPLKIFLPLSFALVAFGVAWGLISTFALGRLADLSTLVIVMTGIQVAVVGLLAEMMNLRLPCQQRDNREADGSRGGRRGGEKR